MSTTVDNRVVEMRFDNKEFESNVKTSMKTLSDLKKGLDFGDSAKGLESISKSASRVSFDGLTSGIESVRAKFSILDISVATIFNRITNYAIDTGNKIFSSITSSIRMGFSEYETQINAVQTILSNTQATTKQVVKQMSAETQAELQATLESTIVSNEEVLNNLEKTHKEELRSYEKLADEELEILEDKHDAEMDALEDAVEEELKLLKASHNEKLDLYEEEYMGKLKVIDEERYAKIKALDDEINAINKLTEQEEEELKLKEQAKKLAELQSNIDNAATEEARLKAEEKLVEYQEKLARESLLAERKAQIAELELTKDNINAEYDLREDELKAEYELKKEEEKELYDLQVENIKDIAEDEKESLRDVYNEEKKLLKEQISLEKEAIKERQDAEIASLNATHKVALNNISEQLNAVTTVETVSVDPSTLEDVNKALDELNTYADKTIYNFTEMTRNIGTFTAAGIDLNTSVTAIKGIANLAAISGSTSQQASTAMYQLSQALSSGTVKLMDWNSVVNAGMGGQVFQDALKETARVNGVAIDDLIAQYGSFRETLSTGWLTADILTETLEKFTMCTDDMTEAEIENAKAMYAAKGYTEAQIDAIFKLGQNATYAATKVKTLTQLFDTISEAKQSGWTQTWEIIVGDFEEAKSLFTDISDIWGGMITESANARNAMLQGWKDLGGRTALVESMYNVFEGIMNIVTPIREAFREVFPPTTSEQIYNITIAIRDLTEKFKNATSNTEGLKATAKALFAALDIGKQFIVALFGSVGSLIGGIAGLEGGITEVVKVFSDWIVQLSETIRESEVFKKVFNTVTDVILTFATVVSSAFEIAVGKIKEFGAFLSEKFGIGVTSVKEFIESVKEKFDFPGLLTFSEFLTIIKDKAHDVKESVKEMKDSIIESVDSLGDKLANSALGKFFTSLWEGIKTIAAGIGKFATSVGHTLEETFTGGNFSDFIGGLSIGAVSFGLYQLIQSIKSIFEDLGSVSENIVGILDSVKGCFEAYQNSIKADTLMKIASAIGILAAAIVVLAMIDANKLNTALVAISTLFAELMISMSVFGKSTGSLVQVSAACVALAAAVAIMGLTLAGLSKLDPSSLSTGIAAVAALSAIVVASAKVMSKGTTSLVAGTSGLVMFAIAVKVLASVCDDLGELKLDVLIKGIAAAGVLMAEIAGFTRLVGKPEKLVSTAAGLVVMGAAMKVFVSVVEELGLLDIATLAKGLGAMGVALAEIVIAANLMPKDMISKGAGLTVIATAMNILAAALTNMSDMTWEQIAKGMVTMGGAMLILVAGLYAMKNTTSGSAALLIAASAMLVLAPALKLLGNLELEEIGTGLLALAGVLVVLGAAAFVLQPLIPAITSLAAAIALVGVGALGIGAALLAAGAGLSALAVGFGALADLGSRGAVAVAKALNTIIVGVADTIVVIGKKLGEAVVAFGQAIINGAPVIAEAAVVVIRSIVDALVESVPLVVEGVVQILTSTITVIAEYAPEICKGVLSIVTSVISAIAAALPDILKGVFDILMSVLDAIVEYAPRLIRAGFEILVGILDAIADGLPDVVQSAINVVISFINGVTEKLPAVIQAGFELLIAFIQGITDAINKNTPMLVQTMKDLFLALIGAALEVLKGAIELVWEAGKKLIDSGLIQGAWSKLKDFANKIGQIIAAGIEAITNKLGEWLQAGKDLIAKVIAGITNKVTAFTNEVGELINSGLQAIKDKFSEWTTAGKNLISNVVSGISSKYYSIRYEVEDLIDYAKEAIKDKFTEWKDIGKNLVSGLISGIKDKTDDLIDELEDLATDTLKAVKKILGIKSPSREFAEIGRYSDEGLIMGLKAYAGGVVDTAKNVGSDMLTAMADTVAGISTIIGDDDWEPTIRPVLDMSNVESGMRGIDALFSKTQAMQLNTQMNASAFKMGNTGAAESVPQGTTYQFTQNNYSPKALSRIDIYRQTKNQFSALKGLVEA